MLWLTLLFAFLSHNAIACGDHYIDKDGNRIELESIPIKYSAEKTAQILNKARALYHEKTHKKLPARIVNNLKAIQKHGAELETVSEQYLNKNLMLLIQNMIADKNNYFVKLAELVNFDFAPTFEELKRYDELNRPPDDLNPEILRPYGDKNSDIFRPYNKQFVLDKATKYKRLTSDYLNEINF